MNRYNFDEKDKEISPDEFKEMIHDIFASPEYDEELIQVYKLFDQDEKGISA